MAQYIFRPNSSTGGPHQRFGLTTAPVLEFRLTIASIRSQMDPSLNPRRNGPSPELAGTSPRRSCKRRSNRRLLVLAGSCRRYTRKTLARVGRHLLRRAYAAGGAGDGAFKHHVFHWRHFITVVGRPRSVTALANCSGRTLSGSNLTCATCVL